MYDLIVRAKTAAPINGFNVVLNIFSRTNSVTMGQKHRIVLFIMHTYLRLFLELNRVKLHTESHNWIQTKSRKFCHHITISSF